MLRLLRLHVWAVLAIAGLSARASEPVLRTWTVAGVAREALVALPSAGTQPAPTVFVFHGHGGSMRNVARSFALHTLWPEALVVYPQGLATPGKLTDPEGRRSGWQHNAGDQGDRDLAFVDTLVRSFRAEGLADPRRLYATGHSNGGAFTYLLWSTRANTFAAFAPSAAAFGLPQASTAFRTPRPLLHFASRNDPLVRFVWQERTLEGARQANQCESTAEPWLAEAAHATRYPSPVGAPVIVWVGSEGHSLPRAAPALMVRFFREQAATGSDNGPRTHAQPVGPVDPAPNPASPSG